MNKKKFQNAISNINPGENFNNKTIEYLNDKFKEDINLNKNSKPITTRIFRYGTIAATIAIVLTAIVIITNLVVISPVVERPSNIQATNYESENKIITKFSEGRHVKVVDLSNGQLNFSEYKYKLPKLLKFGKVLKNYVKWGISKVNEYFGKDVRPGYIPADLNSNFDYDKYEHVVFISDGYVYRDNITYIYKKDLEDPSSPNLSVCVSKGKIPETDFYFVGGEHGFRLSKEVSTIGETSVSVQHNKEGYCAKFMYQNNGYFISSDGISQEEFIKVLMSIVK